MEIRLSEALNRRLPLFVFLASGAVELLSYWGWHAPIVRTLMLALLALGGAFLSVRDLRWLFALIMIEMVIGSHGRLFHAEILGFSLSIRMTLFALLIAGWGMRALCGRTRIAHLRHARVAAPLTLLLAALALGAVRGLSTGAPLTAVFNDANGYAFILLIPIALDLFSDRHAFAWLLRALSGAVAWLSVKSVLLLYLFSHAYDGGWLRDVFLWQRRFGLSEITHLSGGAVRVFAASDVLLLPALFLGALFLFERRSRALWLWTSLVAAAFLLSLSRSFWLGALIAAACMLPVFIRFEIIPFARLGRLFSTAMLALASGTFLLAAVVLFPLPKPVQDASSWNAYGGRFLNASDAAVSSRWNMLAPLQADIARSPILGSGFGTHITYQSDDPRMHDLYPGGTVTTAAIEWQYLEIWLKTGLLGVIAVAWLWWRTGLFFWKTIETTGGADRLTAAGFMLSFLAFVVANIFTPYLNHPLGWAFLSFLITGFHAMQPQEAQESHRGFTPATIR